MYKDDILKLINQSPLDIDTELQLTGRPPTMASSEFLTNKEQGDWAERIVFKAINEVFVIVDVLLIIPVNTTEPI